MRHYVLGLSAHCRVAFDYEILTLRYFGSAMTAEISCPSGHRMMHWNSQLKFRFFGKFGNNFIWEHVHNAEVTSLPIVSEASFYRMQCKYVEPSVQMFSRHPTSCKATRAAMYKAEQSRTPI